MKPTREYNYDSRTLANWYYDRILEGSGSYYSIFKKVKNDVGAQRTIIALMKAMDKIFCDKNLKIGLIKKAIVYILECFPEGALSRGEIINRVINSLEVSPQVIEKSTKAGGRSNLESEIGWEIYHLLNEGKIQRVSRGYYKAC